MGAKFSEGLNPLAMRSPLWRVARRPSFWHVDDDDDDDDDDEIIVDNDNWW